MKHPEMIKREREERFRTIRDRYWYRWMGIFTLALIAIVALIYAVHYTAHAVVVCLVSGVLVVGIVVAERLARQRASDETAQAAAAGRQPPVE